MKKLLLALMMLFSLCSIVNAQSTSWKLYYMVDELSTPTPKKGKYIAISGEGVFSESNKTTGAPLSSRIIITKNDFIIQLYKHEDGTPKALTYSKNPLNLLIIDPRNKKHSASLYESKENRLIPYPRYAGPLTKKGIYELFKMPGEYKFHISYWEDYKLPYNKTSLSFTIDADNFESAYSALHEKSNRKNKREK